MNGETGAPWLIKIKESVDWKGLFDWDMGKVYAMLGVNVGALLSELNALIQLAIGCLTLYILIQKIRKDHNKPSKRKSE
jgi:hypothetical protein